MTGKGTGAISTVQVFGDGAEAAVAGIFKPAHGGATVFRPGRILLGTIVDGDETIDQVTVGCEEDKTLAIHCHGNPLIVEMIMDLLQRHGVELTTARPLLASKLTAQGKLGTIAIEAKISQAKARTLEGTKIILNQMDAGLNAKAREWLDSLEGMQLDKIKAEAGRILGDSSEARLIIYGCTAVIVGPPNSGKSTLFNQLCGSQKAIVTDIKGTTRDWVSARCKIGPLSVELIDTAGLGEASLALSEGFVEKAARQKTVEVLESADLVLLVLDNSQPANQLDARLIEIIGGRNVLTVFNKCDLPAKFDRDKLPEVSHEAVHISARLGTGIRNLVERIHSVSGVTSFDLQSPICFNERQRRLLRQLATTESKEDARSTITELLGGHLNV
jgi:tRNA modification GTPase